LWQTGVLHGSAVLRPLTGDAEIILAEADGLPAARVTALLSAVVVSIGDIGPVHPGDIRALSIADRERILLTVYARTFGMRVETILQCSSCAEWLEVPLELDALLDQPTDSSSDADHQLAFEMTTLHFCLPDGGSQERAACIARRDPERGAEALRDACVKEWVDSNGIALPIASMPPECQAALEDALRQLDPLFETSVTLICPNCGESTTGAVDGLTLLLAELDPPGRVFADVARLASAFHWSEAAILALPTRRRRRYVAMLATEVAA
jgi:hypothetical protein